MKRTKRKMFLRISLMLCALWLVFMTVFGFWQISLKREALLDEITLLMQNQCRNISELYYEYYNTEPAGNMLLEVEPMSDIAALLTFRLTQQCAYWDMEQACYDENWNLLAQSGDYLLVHYEVPSQTPGWVFGQTHCAVLDIRQILSESDADRLMEYLSYPRPDTWSSGALVGYDFEIGAFWTDGKTVIPREFVVTEIHAAEEDIVDFIAASFEADGTLVPGSEEIVWYYQNEALDEVTEDMILIAPDQGDTFELFPLSGRRNEQAKAQVLDVQKAKENWYDTQSSYYDSSGSIAAEGFFTASFYSVWMNEAVENVGVEGNGSITLAAAGNVYPLRESLKTIGPVALCSGLLFLMVAIILFWQMEKLFHGQMELENRRRSLTNAIAHELKTPMAAVLGYAENLQEQTRPDKQTHYLSAIQTQTKRMNEILMKMLEISRVESPETAPVLSAFSLAEVCREAAEACFSGEGMYLISGDAEIVADREMLRRCMDNFLSNARRHASPGGIVTISIEAGECRIYNPGERIPENRLEQIWQPYYQIDTARSGGGSGLGLSIVREILTQHGFTFGAENQDDGVVFWFRFGEAQSAERGGEKRKKRRRILVIVLLVLALIAAVAACAWQIYMPRAGIVLG